MIDNTPVSMYICKSRVDVNILSILVMAYDCVCVSFDVSLIVGIRVLSLYIRAGIIQDLQRFNSVCILTFDDMMLVETNIQLFISPSSMCDFLVI